MFDALTTLLAVAFLFTAACIGIGVIPAIEGTDTTARVLGTVAIAAAMLIIRDWIGRGDHAG